MIWSREDPLSCAQVKSTKHHGLITSINHMVLLLLLFVVSRIQLIGYQPERITLHDDQSRSKSAEQRKESMLILKRMVFFAHLLIWRTSTVIYVFYCLLPRFEYAINWSSGTVVTGIMQLPLRVNQLVYCIN